MLHLPFSDRHVTSFQLHSILPTELPDFEEGSSDSKDINEDEISSEEDKEVGEEDSKPELSGEDSDDESDLDADLAGDVEAVSVGTSSAGSSGDDGEGKIAKVGTKRKGFLEGGKDDTLARAFARIVDSPADMIGDGAPILAVRNAACCLQPRPLNWLPGFIQIQYKTLTLQIVCALNAGKQVDCKTARGRRRASQNRSCRQETANRDEATRSRFTCTSWL